MTEATSESLRTCVLVKRKVLDPKDALTWSGQAARRFLGSELAARFDWDGAKVGLYRSIEGEPDLTLLSSRIAELGAKLCYPRIDGQQKGVFEFVEPAPGTSWAPGKLGVLEPVQATLVAPADLSLIVVPGVVFGMNGERIGRGMGFYDRFLPRAPQVVRVAIAFEFQLEQKVPQNPWDQRVHWIFTEKQAIQSDL